MRPASSLPVSLLLGACFLIAGCGPQGSDRASDAEGEGSRDTASASAGDAEAGRDVFRFETFGNERFWTDAVRVPEGVQTAKVTPLQAMQLGLSVDVEALDGKTRETLAAQLKADPSGKTSALLNDPATTTQLINTNAVIGLPVKDANGDGTMDVAKGDKVGVTCALCHTITDGSAFSLPNGGSAGRRQDGRTNHNLNVGRVLAAGANSRAVYPILQLTLKANKGQTYGRAPKGLTAASTEAEVDAYLSNPKFYPVGMFDDTFDGNGDPLQITPFFRQDLAAPFGSGGEFAKLEDFNNLVYTALLDQTNLTTPGGRALLQQLGGPAGAEIADEYVKVLAATNVTGYPFVQAAPHSQPGSQEAPAGVRVDNAKLLDLNAYLVGLPAPEGADVSDDAAEQGSRLFASAGCTNCHNADQGEPVRDTVFPMKQIFPGDDPTVLAQRKPPLNPIMDTPGNPFDDKQAVVNASMRGGIRGIALPLLLDLARKPAFLHDKTVAGLEALLDPRRGAAAPHAFYVRDAGERAALVAFLRSMDSDTEAGE